MRDCPLVLSYSKQMACMETPWRNGSASDSRSEGCVFKSRRGQYFFKQYSEKYRSNLKTNVVRWSMSRQNQRLLVTIRKMSAIWVCHKVTWFVSASCKKPQSPHSTCTKHPFRCNVMFWLRNTWQVLVPMRLENLSPQWGSNSRPLVYKTSALATELWRQVCTVRR